MKSGRVLWFEPTRGIGFLEEAETGAEVFFNIQGVAAGQQRSLYAGADVSFDAGEDEKLGKPIAVNVSARRK